MLRALSTHVFLRQRLHPGLLDTLARGGAQAIEVFAARQHFDYTSRQHIKEIADWFQSSEVKPHSLHAPIYADSDMGRGGMPAINVVHHEKSRRIDGMDEVKRALEAAEILPYQFLVLHIGDRDSEWDERALENALTAIEHLKAFGGPLGVKLLLENIQNDVTTPANLPRSSASATSQTSASASTSVTPISCKASIHRSKPCCRSSAPRICTTTITTATHICGPATAPSNGSSPSPRSNGAALARRAA